MATLEEQIAHFWSNVDQSGGEHSCWIWKLSSCKTTGYGQAATIRSLPGSPLSVVTTAHRQAWIITNGDPGYHTSPKSGRKITNRICHRCPGGPNRLCCNPSHMEKGTDKSNASHRYEDGNELVGELVFNSKLTAEKVRTARWLFENQVATLVELAPIYGVAYGTISPAVKKKTWKHVS